MHLCTHPSPRGTHTLKYPGKTSQIGSLRNEGCCAAVVGVHGRVGASHSKGGGVGGRSRTHTSTNTNTHMGLMRRGGRGKEEQRLTMAGAGPVSRVVILLCTVHDMMIMTMIKTYHRGHSCFLRSPLGLSCSCSQRSRRSRVNCNQPLNQIKPKAGLDGRSSRSDNPQRQPLLCLLFLVPP